MSKQHGQSILIDIDLNSDEDALRTWLAGQAQADMPWLLAYADDGVIWGRREPDGKLVLSSDVFSDPTEYPSVAAKLRAETLQEVRVFGPGGEVRVWRTGGGLDATLLTEAVVGLETLPDERHLLWHLGSPTAVSQEFGFALVQQGAQGNRHAPPVIPQEGQRLQLVVRHYVDYDSEGQVYIALSRLVGIEGGRQ
jgi:CRISPR-associated protein (TIGR03984 family)